MINIGAATTSQDAFYEAAILFSFYLVSLSNGSILKESTCCLQQSIFKYNRNNIVHMWLYRGVNSLLSTRLG